MKWISVKESLPDDKDGCCSHECVLVLSKEGSITFAQYYKPNWELLFDNGDKGVYSCVGRVGFDREKITHWMPLPSAPKDNNE